MFFLEGEIFQTKL